MFPRTRNIQHGFSLIMGIFLIVVLGGIAVFLGRVATMQYHASALDEEGVLVYQAARAGVEWGAYQALRNSSCSGSSTLTFPATSVLVHDTVTVTFTQTVATEGTSAINVCQIISAAHNGNNPAGDYYVERQLQVTVAK